MKVHITVQDAPLESGAPLKWLHDQGLSGAIVHFSGHVRDEDGRVDALHLEHYPGMTERLLSTIVEHAAARWHINGAWVVHRVGTMRRGDEIVQVAVSAQHRQAAFDACAFIMDVLKTRAPFWKKELIDGRWHWVDARASDALAAGSWQDAGSEHEPR